MSDAGFSPLNDLEQVFRSVRALEAPVTVFMDALQEA